MDYLVILKDYQTFVIGALTLIIMIIGFVAAYSQLKLMKESRYAEIIVHLMNMLYSEPAIKSRIEVEETREGREHLIKKLKEYEKSEDTKIYTHFYSLLYIGNLFNYAGTLVNNKLITLEMIAPTFGGMIYYYHDRYNNFLYNDLQRLFCWDNIDVEDDKNKLKKYLNFYNIPFGETTEIRKENNGMTIKISEKAKIDMAKDKNKATVFIDGKGTYELRVESENGVLIIYDTMFKEFEDLKKLAYMVKNYKKKNRFFRLIGYLKFWR